MTQRVDHARVVQMFTKSDNLPLIKPYLVSIQHINVPAVNMAFNELLIEEEDHDTLRDSIERSDNFDNVQLAQKLERHELLEFRRLASLLYKKNRKWKQSVALSKQDKLYKDAMQTVFESKDSEMAEELLAFFIQSDLKECFAAMLYLCYDLFKPDVILELAWRHRLTDFAMPFMIQSMREMSQKIEKIEKMNDESRGQEQGNFLALMHWSALHVLIVYCSRYGLWRWYADAIDDHTRPWYGRWPNAASKRGCYERLCLSRRLLNK